MNENTKFRSIVSNGPIQDGLSFEEWKEYGRNLGRIEKMYMWKVGEWWVYGAINYGEKTSITKSDDWDGPSYKRVRMWLGFQKVPLFAPTRKLELEPSSGGRWLG